MNRTLSKKVFVVSILTSGAFAFGFLIGTDDYFKINRSLELFGSVFREISSNYVDDIDPEVFVRTGIDGMLSSLDPYTEYYDEKSGEDLDILTNGVYTGLGITVANHDSNLVITGLQEQGGAYRAGLKIGDIIYSIDNKVVEHLPQKDLREYTRGEAGTIAKVRALRTGRADTLNFDVSREEIKIRNIPFYGMIGDSIGFIKLDRFTRRTPEDVRNALVDLKSRGGMHGVILDIRDNPGGLLEAAVGVVELFVQPGNKVVSTRGRDLESERTYFSQALPVDVSLPLAVLINSRSASASEIVAGAIQDLDRGIVLGERSFGKGLVQTIVPLPYNANMKLTTAKYYTPSGRCIQKIDYIKKRNGVLTPVTKDSAVFLTKHKRKVHEGRGIAPDSSLSEIAYSDFVNALGMKNAYFKFATQWASQREKLAEDFRVDKSVLQEFDKYISGLSIESKETLAGRMEKIRGEAATEKVSAQTLQKIDEARSALANEEESSLVTKNEKIIRVLLEREISQRFFSEEVTVRRSLKNDPVVSTAKNLLRPREYNAILTDDGRN